MLYYAVLKGTLFYCASFYSTLLTKIDLFNSTAYLECDLHLFTLKCELQHLGDYLLLWSDALCPIDSINVLSCLPVFMSSCHLEVGHIALFYYTLHPALLHAMHCTLPHLSAYTISLDCTPEHVNISEQETLQLKRWLTGFPWNLTALFTIRTTKTPLRTSLSRGMPTVRTHPSCTCCCIFGVTNVSYF